MKSSIIYMPDGKKVDIFNMSIDDIDYKYFGMCLPNICRWGARVPYHYSVAQHCLELYWYLSLRGEKELAKMALIHDGCEAYIGDIILPIKQQMPEFLKLEDHITKLVFEKYNVDYSLEEEFTYYDRNIAVNEAYALEIYDHVKEEPVMQKFVELPGLCITPMAIDYVRTKYMNTLEEVLNG